jgi:hypothetical protein
MAIHALIRLGTSMATTLSPQACGEICTLNTLLNRSDSRSLSDYLKSKRRQVRRGLPHFSFFWVLLRLNRKTGCPLGRRTLGVEGEETGEDFITYVGRPEQAVLIGVIVVILLIQEY